jgi:hypothetical protein
MKDRGVSTVAAVGLLEVILWNHVVIATLLRRCVSTSVNRRGMA